MGSQGSKILFVSDSASNDVTTDIIMLIEYISYDSPVGFQFILQGLYGNTYITSLSYQKTTYYLHKDLILI